MLFYRNKYTGRAFMACFIFTVLIVATVTLACRAGGAASPPMGGSTVNNSGQKDLDFLSSRRLEFLNDRARDITGAAALNTPGFVVPDGLTGEGQIVAIADSGLDIGRTDDIHPDLRSTPGKMPKVVLLKSWAGRDVPDDPSGHGTHMAATIAGTGVASDGKFRGVAPGASIYFQSILNKDGEPAPPPRLNDLFWPAYSAGARVHVDGWGGGPDTYLQSAAQVDDFVRAHPDFLVVFGAGNGGPSPGAITAEANSKNALTVGASVLPRPALVPGPDDTCAVADFSSRGPAGDGRIKPELLAPGSAVVSARSRLVDGNLTGYPDYTLMQGTSMAAAVAGGSTALLLEYFKEYQKIPTPSAALLKAALVNGSRPATGGPSKEGFGVIDLAGTVIALKEGSFQLADEWAGVSQGNEMSYTFHVTDPTVPFKATLAWTDPPNEPGSTRALVNDLDLVVRTPDGKTYYGNHFLGKNSPDRMNNVEQVYLPTPVPGDYTMRVTGAVVSHNTVRGSGVAAQDYALVWGQPPGEDVVKKFNGERVVLKDGATFSSADVPVVNLVNDTLTPADKDHLFPGSAVFRTPQRAYLVSRLWRAKGVKALKLAEGTVFTEINPAAMQGGYTMAGEAGSVNLNDSLASPDALPPGFEVSAVINPFDQRIWQVSATYVEREGIVSTVRSENGQKMLYLAGGRGAYRISPEAAYSYDDNYANADVEDLPFGTGTLEEFKEVLPGMPVRLRLAPSSGEVQYLAVKRWVALGTIREIDPATGDFRMENGTSYRILPGAPIKRDRNISSINEIRQGDQVAAVLLPDTGEVIGLVAYSRVLYGKAIGFTKKDSTVYFQDDNGRYRSLYLPSDAIVYRWGVRTTADAIAAGSRIRIATDPEGKEAWRLDITDVFDDQAVLSEYNKAAGIFSVEGGGSFRVSGSTRFYINGYPVPPEELRPGEQLEVEYAVAPPRADKVLVSVNAHTTARTPLLLASAVPLQDRLVITGRTGANAAVYLWGDEGLEWTIAVDKSGSFNFTLPRDGDKTGRNFTLVAVDRRTGGVTGRPVSLAGSGQRDDYDGVVSNALSGIIGRAEADILSSRSGAGLEELGHASSRNVPNSETPLTRTEAVAVISRLFSWPRTSEWPVAFADAEDIPVLFRPAVAEARARGIIRGYPDGRFQPMAALSRSEAAVIFAAVLRDLGLAVEPFDLQPYFDAGDIPPWAAPAVAETSAAGLLRGRPDGVFAPGNPVTAGEMASILTRLLEFCQERYVETGP